MKTSFGLLKLNRKSAGTNSGDIPLPITSMADIFTILLVFLLKGFASGALTVTPSAGLMLPASQNADSKSLDAVKVEISEKGIQIESKAIVALDHYKLDSKSQPKNGTIPALVSEFEKERKRQEFISKTNEDVKNDQRIIVIADQKVPYETIKLVLASAATQGYTDFKLAVINKE